MRYQYKISPLSEQTMPPLDKETVLFHIDSLKRSNCRILSEILNKYWSSAAFDHNALDFQKIQFLLKKIKANGLTMQKICQNQPSYTPWTLVSTRKHKCTTNLSEPKTKRRKSM